MYVVRGGRRGGMAFVSPTACLPQRAAHRSTLLSAPVCIDNPNIKWNTAHLPSLLSVQAPAVRHVSRHLQSRRGARRQPSSQPARGGGINGVGGTGRTGGSRGGPCGGGNGSGDGDGDGSGMLPGGGGGGGHGAALLLSGAVAYEVNGASRCNYSLEDGTGAVTVERVNADAKRGRFFEEIRTFFLPENFPESVGPSYAAYSIWRGLQNIISAMTAVLSTQALLSAVGIGPGASQSVAAATSWVLKDGFGSLGKLLTARMGGSFDSESKMYRLASDLLFDAGISLELITPMFPGSFLVLAAAGNFVKSVSMAMGMSCRASVLATFVLRENLGDISSKNDAQNTVANLTGLGLGIGAARLLPETTGVRLAVFWGLTSVYSLLNYMSMKSVTLRTLNRQRAGIVIESFLADEPIPSPAYANKHERIIPFVRKRFADPKLRLGAPLSALEDGLSAQLVSARRAKDAFIMDIGPRSVDVVLHRDATSNDQLEAFLAYCHLRMSLRDSLDGGRCRSVRMLDERRTRCIPTVKRIWGSIDPARRYKLLGASRAYAKKNVSRLKKELDKAGYSTGTLLFSPSRTRAVY